MLVFNYLLTSKSFVTLVLRVNTSPHGTVAEGETGFFFQSVTSARMISASVLHTSTEN